MKPFAILALAVAAASCTATDEGPPTEMSAATQGELSAALRDYQPAGPPLACVAQRDLRGNRSAGDAIIFDGRNRGVIYVNRPAGGCPDLNFNRTLITRTFATRLCRGDIAQVADLTSGITYGGCGLGDFVPYRRVGR